jgi:hypothetical protein
MPIGRYSERFLRISSENGKTRWCASEKRLELDKKEKNHMKKRQKSARFQKKSASFQIGRCFLNTYTEGA